ncbi:MAG: four helix bundle protein [Bacteroidetes bacterium]|nr:four helix bundle protein [Bacteroidota bacterium]
MATVRQFEDLEVWQKSISLVQEIYLQFKDCKDYGFKDQIQRASVSIPSNIAEGFERNTDQDTSRFFIIAKSSAGEVRTQLHIAFLLGYVQEIESITLIEKATTISKMLATLIKYRLK